MTFAERFPATRHRDFRILWLGMTCSSIALWTMIIGNAWVVYELSDSSRNVGFATFAFMLAFLLAPIGGTIGPGFERRKLTRSTRLVTISVSCVLLVLTLSGGLVVWAVVAFAAVLGMLRAVEIPSDQALLANVVPEEDIGNAVALASMTQHGSKAIGPLIGGPLLATIGAEGSYAIALVFTVVAFFALGHVQTVSRGGITKFSEVAANLREGVSYVGSQKPILALFVLLAAHCSLTMSFDAMLPGFAKNELGGGAGLFTALAVGVGAGALTGTFILSANARAPRGPLLLISAFASGLAPILIAVSGTAVLAAGSAYLMGLTQAMFMALTIILLQEVVPDALRGRVMSLFLLSAGGIMAFANLGYGTAADAWGAPPLFLVPGAAFVVFVALSWLLVTQLRTLFTTGRITLTPQAQAEIPLAAG